MESKTQAEEEAAARNRYLIGELSERDRERLEEAYFADDANFEQMLIAEDELIDAYARDQLSAEERGRFEQLFLASARGRERVKFARALNNVLPDAPHANIKRETAQPSLPSFFAAWGMRGAAFRYALVVAALFAVVSLAWFLFERARMRNELPQSRDESASLRERAQESEREVAAQQARSTAELLAQREGERSRSTQEDGRQETESGRVNPLRRNHHPPLAPVKKHDAATARRLPRPTPETTLLNTANATLVSASESRRIDQLPLQGRTVVGRLGGVSFVLTPGLVRGGGANTLALPKGATSLFLQLNLETDSHKHYRAVIETAEGQEVWRADALSPAATDTPKGNIKLPSLPAKLLPPGNYVLLLTGATPDGNFESVSEYSFRVVRK